MGLGSESQPSAGTGWDWGLSPRPQAGTGDWVPAAGWDWIGLGTESLAAG